MQCTDVSLLLLLVGAIIEVAYGQSVHVVSVGDTGSFYDPPIVSAIKGDLVVFRFTGTFHSVSQSSFAGPCTPLPGGFDSGVAGNPPQTVGPIPEWNLTITDDTKPIWYFCKVTRPESHCTAGMVGAINAVTAGTNQSFDVFVQAAKSLTAVPPAASGASLLGVGALATATPTPRSGTNVTVNSTSTSTSSSTTAAPTSSSSISTTAPTQSPTESPSTSAALSTADKGGIAGGVVAAAIVVILLVLLFLSYRRGRRLRDEAAANKTLHSSSSRDMSHLGGPILPYEGAPHESGPKVPPQIDRFHRSAASQSVTDSLELEDSAGPSVSIRDLAAEVAIYMRQESGSGDAARARQAQDTGGLATVPELGGSTSAESSRTPRQLPRPPPSSLKRAEDTYSVDTLPEYVKAQPR